jgi:hypothetical protein
LKARTTTQQANWLDDPTARDPALRGSGVQARAERHVSSPPAPSVVEASPLIDIGAPADPALLEPTCAYLAAYCELCLPPQVTQRLNVAIYELYANGLRYGSSQGEVRLTLTKTARGAKVSVTNHAEPAQLERLRGHVARIQADPEAAFSGEMNRFAASRSQPPPMVGLVRIAHECGLAIELRVAGERVEVSTSCEG